MEEGNEDDEQESAQYQLLLGILDMAKKNFFQLEADEKLQIIKLLIGEHLASDDLKDFQLNFETYLKNSKRTVKEERAQLIELNKELVEINKAEENVADDQQQHYSLEF